VIGETTEDKILERLAKTKLEYGQLPRAVELYDELLRLQREVRSRVVVTSASLTEEEVDKRLNNKKPILEFGNLSLDWVLVQEAFMSIVEAVVGYVEVIAEAESQYCMSYWPNCLEDIRACNIWVESITSSTFPLHQAVEDWYQGSSLVAIALASGISEELLGAIIRATMQPFLKVCSDGLIGLVNQKQWRRRFCPVCGGEADFAFLEKESGARWLLCSRCDAEWLFQRLKCPYCDTTNQKSLAYFTNDVGLYRLYVCDECHHYIKAIDLRNTGSDVLLPLEKVVTIDLDRQAQENGYNAKWIGILPFDVIVEPC